MSPRCVRAAPRTAEAEAGRAGEGRRWPGPAWAGGAGRGWDCGQVTRRTLSHGRARGCAGLLQPQRFTQPAGKIHFFHLGALDEGVALQRGEACQEGHGPPTAARGGQGGGGVVVLGGGR